MPFYEDPFFRLGFYTIIGIVALVIVCIEVQARREKKIQRTKWRIWKNLVDERDPTKKIANMTRPPEKQTSCCGAVFFYRGAAYCPKCGRKVN